MLIFLPDRIYDYFKNDETYVSMVSELNKKVYDEEDHYNMKNFLIEYDEYAEIAEYMRQHINSELKDELDITIDNRGSIVNKYLERYDEYDVETKIMLLYCLDGGIINMREEIIGRMNKIINLYENHPNEQFSNFIHIIYYFARLYVGLINLMKHGLNNIPMSDITKLIIEEEKVFQTLIEKIDSEQFYNILCHKRIQVAAFFMKMVGQFNDYKEIARIIINIFNNNEFKYSKFNYSSLLFYNLLFMRAFDDEDYSYAKSNLDKMIEMVNYGFSHKQEMVKSLNHFNKCFTVNYCNFLFYFVNMIRQYLPNKMKDLTIFDSEDMTEFERNLVDETLTKEEISLGINYNNIEDFSLDWCRGNKISFNYFNNLIDNL